MQIVSMGLNRQGPNSERDFAALWDVKSGRRVTETRSLGAMQRRRQGRRPPLGERSTALRQFQLGMREKDFSVEGLEVVELEERESLMGIT